MVKRISKRLSAVLAIAMLLTCFAYAQPVNAASKGDMQKANVKWDLKNNKTLKFKTKWSSLGTKTSTVKMTNYKVKNAKKKGYKQCTFTLTYTRPDLKMKSGQINDMFFLSSEMEMGGLSSDNGPFGGGFWYTVVDYKTGKCLEGKNDKKVTVTRSDWKYSKKVTKTSSDDLSIWYYRKATVNVKIIYPKNYKNLAIGVGGYTSAPHFYVESSSSTAGDEDDPLAGTGVGTASSGGGIRTLNLNSFWNGKKQFSKETRLYSKKDKSFAHFRRVKN